jgi:exonuclease VII small subunit
LNDRSVTLDGLLDRLEASIALLSEGSAPLEELVRTHEEAVRLADAAGASLAELRVWAAEQGGDATGPARK